MIQGSQSGTVLGLLSFKVGGETLNPPQSMVLSCGGIFFPRRKIPTFLRTWQQIVNLPGEEMTAKIFGFRPADPKEDLLTIFQKEGLN